jgi:TetR/AcrR family transcriptional repressor of lmrAB and yxaGH operons
MSKGAQTKQRFVESTLRLIRRNGFSGTGVLDVVADSGAPRGSLYFHFPGGKEELAIAAVESGSEQLLAWIGRTNLRQFFHQYARWIEKNDCQDGCPIAAIAAEGASSEPLRLAAEAALSAMSDAFAVKLREMGHAERRAHDLADMLVGAFEGAVVLTRARRDAAPMRLAFDRLESLLEVT